jgi:uncharacterized membrane protein YphA (DoxX/SURF4 family)
VTIHQVGNEGAERNAHPVTFIAIAALSGVLAVVLFLSGAGKLAGEKTQVATMRRVNFPADKVWLLAVVEIAAGVGLVAGLFWPPIGFAAAVGLVAYFVAAVGAHLRQSDRAVAVPIALMTAAAVVLVLRAVST